MQGGLTEFFKESHTINWLLGNPADTGKVSFSVFVAAIAFIYVIYRIIRIVKRRIAHPTSLSESIYELFTSPLKGSMQISATILQDAVRAHYRTKLPDFLKKYWLSIAGAIFILIFIYGV